MAFKAEPQMSIVDLIFHLGSVVRNKTAQAPKMIGFEQLWPGGATVCAFRTHDMGQKPLYDPHSYQTRSSAQGNCSAKSLAW